MGFLAATYVLDHLAPETFQPHEGGQWPHEGGQRGVQWNRSPHKGILLPERSLGRSGKAAGENYDVLDPCRKAMNGNNKLWAELKYEGRRNLNVEAG